MVKKSKKNDKRGFFTTSVPTKVLKEERNTKEKAALSDAALLNANEKDVVTLNYDSPSLILKEYQKHGAIYLVPSVTFCSFTKISDQVAEELVKLSKHISQTSKNPANISLDFPVSATEVINDKTLALLSSSETFTEVSNETLIKRICRTMREAEVLHIESQDVEVLLKETSSLKIEKLVFEKMLKNDAFNFRYKAFDHSALYAGDQKLSIISNKSVEHFDEVSNGSMELSTADELNKSSRQNGSQKTSLSRDSSRKLECENSKLQKDQIDDILNATALIEDMENESNLSHRFARIKLNCFRHRAAISKAQKSGLDHKPLQKNLDKIKERLNSICEDPLFTLNDGIQLYKSYLKKYHAGDVSSDLQVLIQEFGLEKKNNGLGNDSNDHNKLAEAENSLGYNLELLQANESRSDFKILEMDLQGSGHIFQLLHYILQEECSVSEIKWELMHSNPFSYRLKTNNALKNETIIEKRGIGFRTSFEARIYLCLEMIFQSNLYKILFDSIPYHMIKAFYEMKCKSTIMYQGLNAWREYQNTLLLAANFRKSLSNIVFPSQFSTDNSTFKDIDEHHHNIENISCEEADDWRQILRKHRSSKKYNELLGDRSELPIWPFKPQIISTIKSNRVTCIRGETGSGKSTQVPSMILEEFRSCPENCYILCTQPRRINAISIAQRVSQELGEPTEAQRSNESLIGYSVRFDYRICKYTRILFATVGMALKMMETDRLLQKVTHVIIDEVHERSLENDTMFFLLREILKERADLKLILMSATLDFDLLFNYFGEGNLLHIPGKIFPVKQYFLDDALIKLSNSKTFNDNFMSFLDREIDSSENSADCEIECKFSSSILNYFESEIDFRLIISILEYINHRSKEQIEEPGSILVFLPGIHEIRSLSALLNNHPTFSKDSYAIFQLHSKFMSKFPHDLFGKSSPNLKKIILSTNICESGVTIPDVTHVIDSGKENRMSYNEKSHVNILTQSFISKANVLQRRGRAGRMRPGVAFLLLSKARFDRLDEHPLPEISRLSLQEISLRFKLLGVLSLEDAFKNMITPPPSRSLSKCLRHLHQSGAIDAHENLTVWGQIFARVPLELSLTRTLIWGLKMRCFYPVAIIVAALSEQVSISDFTERAGIKLPITEQCFSEFIALWFAYKKLSTKASIRDEALNNIMRSINLIAEQFHSIFSLANIQILLRRKGIDLHGKLNMSNSKIKSTDRRNSENCNSAFPSMINAAILAGFYPKILVKTKEDWKNAFSVMSVSINPKSSLAALVNTFPRKTIIFYYSLLRSKKRTTANYCAVADPLSVALLCGCSSYDLFCGTLSIDNKLHFAFKDLRKFIAFRVIRETSIANEHLKSDQTPEEFPLTLATSLIENYSKKYSKTLVQHISCKR